MYWDDLNKDNIELVQEYYNDYIQMNKDETYMSNLMSFEEFMQNELVKCDRCGEWQVLDTMEHTHQNGYLCRCCYEDLYNAPTYEEAKVDDYIEQKMIDEYR